MEISVPVIMPPAPQVSQQETAQASNEPPPRLDYLNKGTLIGHDNYSRPVKIEFRNLHRHIMVEGTTEGGKSHFCKFLATQAIKEEGMKVVVMDITHGWTRLVERFDGVIFDNKLDMTEALKHKISLCLVREDALEENESNFLKPFYEYITRER